MPEARAIAHLSSSNHARSLCQRPTREDQGAGPTKMGGVFGMDGESALMLFVNTTGFCVFGLIIVYHYVTAKEE